MQENCQPNKLFKNLTNFITIVAIIAAVPFVLFITRPNNIVLDFFTFLFVCMHVAPYVILFVINNFLNKSSCASLVIYFVALILILAAIGIFYDAFFLHRGPQNGVLLVIVPIVQIIVSLIMGGIIFLRLRKCNA